MPYNFKTKLILSTHAAYENMERSTVDNHDARNKSVYIRYTLLFLVIFCCVFFFQSYSSHTMIYISNNDKFTSLERRQHIDRFTIKTDGCSIPSMKPLDETIKKFVEYPNNLKPCNNSNVTLLENNNTHIWINKENIKYYNQIEDYIVCCYRSFYRPTSVANVMSYKVDDRVNYNKCKYFEDSISVSDEFVRVTCQDDNNKVINDKFFIFTPVKKFNGRVENKTAYNVIVMGIDAVSRMNFHRTMKKTLEYLKGYGAVELLGYNKVGDNTFPNLIPMLMGMKVAELKTTCFPNIKSTFDNCPFVWEWYKQAGYHTALAEDSAWLGTFNYLQNGFIKTPTDYYTHTFFSEAEKHAGNNKIYNAHLCVNENYMYQILLNYIHNITNTLRKFKLFGFFWEISMSHDNLNYPMTMDDSYVQLLRRLQSSKYLDETVLFLVSDHGIRWGGIRSTKQGRLEERLPFVFVLVPPSFRENYKEAYNNLRLNAGRLTTPFDIHATLIDLLNLEDLKNDKIISRSNTAYTGRSISLFQQIPMNRTCILADIDEHWCTCHTSRKVSKESVETIAASEYLIKYLNKLLIVHSQCAKLKLSKILDVTEISVNTSVEKEIGWREFTLVIRSSPGDAIFDATLRYDNGNYSVMGTVSRLNLYGNQSHCVDDYQLKLYCYCL